VQQFSAVYKQSLHTAFWRERSRNASSCLSAQTWVTAGAVEVQQTAAGVVVCTASCDTVARACKCTHACWFPAARHVSCVRYDAVYTPQRAEANFVHLRHASRASEQSRALLCVDRQLWCLGDTQQHVSHRMFQHPSCAVLDSWDYLHRVCHCHKDISKELSQILAQVLAQRALAHWLPDRVCVSLVGGACQAIPKLKRAHVRIHCCVEVTELSTNKQYTLSLLHRLRRAVGKHADAQPARASCGEVLRVDRPQPFVFVSVRTIKRHHHQDECPLYHSSCCSSVSRPQASDSCHRRSAL
jgi:hypothetical protein